jgi:integrase
LALDKISLKSVSLLQRGQTIWDTVVRGFGVRKQRSTPVYVLKYRFKGRQRFVTIGRHASPWLPDEARQEARRLLGLLASEECPRDPAAERDLAQGERLFKEIAERYIADYSAVHKKPRTAAEDQRNLDRHVLPFFGHMKMSDIDKSDLARFMATLRKRPIAANRCLALISHIFSIAEKWKLKRPGQNPCRGVDRYREIARERFLGNDEMAQLGAALNNFTQENWRAVTCIWLLILTGARLGEILALEWTQIRWHEGYARLPASKTGAKNVPLPAPALNVLKKIQDSRGTGITSRYVLPSDRANRHYRGIQKAWRKIRLQAGLDNLRIHDLRHAYASTAVAEGESLFLVGAILGHRQAATTQRYAHLAIQPVIEVANRTANRISELMGPISLSRPNFHRK